MKKLTYILMYILIGASLSSIAFSQHSVPISDTSSHEVNQMDADADADADNKAYQWGNPKFQFALKHLNAIDLSHVAEMDFNSHPRIKIQKQLLNLLEFSNTRFKYYPEFKKQYQEILYPKLLQFFINLEKIAYTDASIADYIKTIGFLIPILDLTNNSSDLYDYNRLNTRLINLIDDLNLNTSDTKPNQNDIDLKLGQLHTAHHLLSTQLMHYDSMLSNIDTSIFNKLQDNAYAFKQQVQASANADVYCRIGEAYSEAMQHQGLSAQLLKEAATGYQHSSQISNDKIAKFETQQILQALEELDITAPPLESMEKLSTDPDAEVILNIKKSDKWITLNTIQDFCNQKFKNNKTYLYEITDKINSLLEQHYKNLDQLAYEKAEISTYLELFVALRETEIGNLTQNTNSILDQHAYNTIDFIIKSDRKSAVSQIRKLDDFFTDKFKNNPEVLLNIKKVFFKLIPQKYLLPLKQALDIDASSLFGYLLTQEAYYLNDKSFSPKMKPLSADSMIAASNRYITPVTTAEECREMYQNTIQSLRLLFYGSSGSYTYILRDDASTLEVIHSIDLQLKDVLLENKEQVNSNSHLDHEQKELLSCLSTKYDQLSTFQLQRIESKITLEQKEKETAKEKDKETTKEKTKTKRKNKKKKSSD